MFSSNLIYFKFWKYLNKKRKIQLLLTLSLTILSGLSELAVINLAIPFLAIITGSEDVSNYPTSIFISKLLQIPNNEELIPAIIIFFGLNILIATILRLINIWI